MADKPADGGMRPEELSAPSERHDREHHGPPDDAHELWSAGDAGDRDPQARWIGDEHDPPLVEDDDQRVRWAGDEHDPPSDEGGDQRVPQAGDERDRWSGEQWAEGSENAEVAWPGPSLKPRLRRFRRFRLSAWIALVLAAAVVGVSVLWGSGPPTEAELWEQAGLSNNRTKNTNGTNNKIRIGVKGDTPYIAERKRGGGFEGFDIEIARMIAADLGYLPKEIEFLSIETEDRARMQGRNDDLMQGRNVEGKSVRADLVVASFSVTPDRQANPAVGFSKPYFFTEQSVVTMEAGTRLPKKITDLKQLRNSRVCTLGTSTSEGALFDATGGQASGTEITGMNSLKDCVEGLKKGDFDAVTTDAALLAGFVKDSAKKGPAERLIHHDLGLEKTEMWAVNAGSNAALRTLVDLSLYRSYADPRDRRWEEAYDKYIRPLDDGSGGYQGSVARAEQPCTLPPPVRRWPWERTLSVLGC
ncbi:transporter substrate-binding domain-containing protein [Streptosporangium subroseum]|uniref:transporter substrate-binding domain-containing protein n=1 Tax=Streptosporangium subroseum TaxID=106412 RepID=UPI0034136370